MLAYIKLFMIFFKVGMFCIGGGLAALPLLQDAITTNNWMTQGQFIDIIAISQSTPGPIGVNVSTYVGFNQLGIFGGIIASLGFVAPSYITIMVVSRFLEQFKENKVIQGIFYGIRPAVVGLIFAAAYRIGIVTFFDSNHSIRYSLHGINIIGVLMCIILFYMTNRYKHHPIIYILGAGLIGIFVF